LLLKGAGANFNLNLAMKSIRDEIKRKRLESYDSPRILELLRDMTEDAAFVCLTRGKSIPADEVFYKVILTTGLITRAFWTPGDVKILANELARRNY
jgi:hypothetical protein